jgi:hypothetical protein
MDMVKFKYREGEHLNEVMEYIASTYEGHYVGKGEIQTTDVWETLHIEKEACISNILKYAMRYGKKNGYNKNDLLKIIHYTLMLWHFTSGEDNGN